MKNAKIFFTNLYKKISRNIDLLLVFGQRDISIRYKQSMLGFWWILVKPLLTVIIFTITFSVILGLKLESPYPYWFFVITGIIPWLFFSFSLGEISNSLLSDADILKKISYPKILSPISALTPSALELLFGFIFLFLIYLVFNNLSFKFLFLPLIFILIILTPLGLGLIFASLSVFYRDFKFIVPFFLQIGIYATPIGYNLKIIPSSLLPFVALNPMVMSIELLRWCFGITTSLPNLIVFLNGSIILILSYILGITLFKKLENRFADYI